MGAGARTGAEQLGLTLVPVIVEQPTTEVTVREAFARIAAQDFDALYVSPSTDVYPTTYWSPSWRPPRACRPSADSANMPRPAC